MKSSSNRLLVGIGVGLVALIVLVLVVSLTRSPMKVEPGTPVAVVQDYVTAVLADDPERAAGHFAPDSRCTADMVEQEGGRNAGSRVELVDEHVSGDTARVTIRIVVPSGGPYPESWDERATIRLARSGDTWVITGSPWPLWDCAEQADR